MDVFILYNGTSIRFVIVMNGLISSLVTSKRCIMSTKSRLVMPFLPSHHFPRSLIISVQMDDWLQTGGFDPAV